MILIMNNKWNFNFVLANTTKKTNVQTEFLRFCFVNDWLSLYVHFQLTEMFKQWIQSNINEISKVCKKNFFGSSNIERATAVVSSWLWYIDQRIAILLRSRSNLNKSDWYSILEMVLKSLDIVCQQQLPSWCTLNHVKWIFPLNSSKSVLYLHAIFYVTINQFLSPKKRNKIQSDTYWPESFYCIVFLFDHHLLYWFKSSICVLILWSVIVMFSQWMNKNDWNSWTLR